MPKRDGSFSSTVISPRAIRRPLTTTSTGSPMRRFERDGRSLLQAHQVRHGHLGAAEDDLHFDRYVHDQRRVRAHRHDARLTWPGKAAAGLFVRSTSRNSSIALVELFLRGALVQCSLPSSARSPIYRRCRLPAGNQPFHDVLPGIERMPDPDRVVLPQLAEFADEQRLLRAPTASPAIARRPRTR